MVAHRRVNVEDSKCQLIAQDSKAWIWEFNLNQPGLLIFITLLRVMETIVLCSGLLEW